MAAESMIAVPEDHAQYNCPSSRSASRQDKFPAETPAPQRKTCLDNAGQVSDHNLKILVVRSFSLRAMLFKRFDEGLSDDLGRTAFKVATFEHAYQLPILQESDRR
jgi:hypothetical protein